MRIEPLTEADLQYIPELQPEGWSDILPHIMFYVSSAFCSPVKVTADGTIVGIGTTIVHGRTAWLAHIIVHRDYRNRGIGQFITQHLIDSLHETPCETVLLIATTLGEPVYKKIGFQKETEYIFLRDGAISPETPSGVVLFSDRYVREMLDLDRKISGEDRQELLIPHIASAHLFVNDGSLLGYYLPDLGDGLVIAGTPEAGLALLIRRSMREKKFVLPLENTAGIEFLFRHGYQEYSRGARMWLGKKLVWHAEMLYNRIGGNLG